MKTNMKSFVSGCLVTATLVGLIGSAGAMVGQRTANLDYNNIKVTLDGQPVDLVDANGNAVEPFAINGTTYLPVRAVANALGLDVGWDQSTQTVVLNVKGSESPAAPESGTSNVGDYYVVINGAEVSTDYDGNRALVVTCTWTNNSEETISALVALTAKAFQNGVQLESALMTGDNFDPNTMTELRPGASTQVQYAFELDGTGAPVEFEVSEAFAFEDTGTVSRTFNV